MEEENNTIENDEKLKSARKYENVLLKLEYADNSNTLLLGYNVN